MTGLIPGGTVFVFVKHPKFGTVLAESLALELTGTILARRATAEHVLNFLSP